MGRERGKLGHKSGDFSSAVLSLWRFGAKKVGIWGIKVGISGVKMEIWGINVGFSFSCAVIVVFRGKRSEDLGHRSGNLGRNIEGFPSAVPALCGFGAKKWEFGV